MDAYHLVLMAYGAAVSFLFVAQHRDLRAARASADENRAFVAKQARDYERLQGWHENQSHRILSGQALVREIEQAIERYRGEREE